MISIWHNAKLTCGLVYPIPVASNQMALGHDKGSNEEYDENCVKEGL